MTKACWKRNMISAVILVVGAMIYNQYVWNPGIRASPDVHSYGDPISTVAYGEKIELYGAEWHLQQVEIPTVRSHDSYAIPVNGRAVGYAFERTSNGEPTHPRSSKVDCVVYVTDGARSWVDDRSPSSVREWIDQNNFTTSCGPDRAGKRFLILRIVPMDVQLVGVDVQFYIDGQAQSVVRFAVD